MNRDTVDQVNQRKLTPEWVLAAYDELVPLYGNVPPLILWRAWELAAYRSYSLDEPVLDIGCGDGRFFRMAFPDVRDVIGVDFNPMVASHAAHSGVYRAVALARADSLPLRTGACASAFANCSLEHMDHLGAVLDGVSETLRPGGTFLLSVVTSDFVSWAPLSRLLSACGAPEIGLQLQEQHETYHHLVNPLPTTEWYERLRQAGFEVVEEVPIVSGAAGQMFLLLDQLWHVGRGKGELGEVMLGWMERTPDSAAAVRQIFAGLMPLASASDEHAGVVLLARKRKHMVGSAQSQNDLARAFLVEDTRRCWCSNESLTPFNDDYARCERCETLVLVGNARDRVGRVVDDTCDFYGRDYWFGHQAKLGHADIEKRARTDLSERCLYWLRTVLRYRRPPGSTLELGCAHGGFVALLRSVGFAAQGLELSPSIADFARQTFDVPVLIGPVEEQRLQKASLDLVLAMDVLEHLDDPLGTLTHCAHLLRPDGAFALQSPCYPEGATYEELRAQRSGFLSMLQPQEHIYLFSRRSIRMLLERLGFGHIVFEPAIFAHYDMFVFASRAPLAIQVTFDGAVPLDTRDARIVQAMFDLDDQVTALKRTLATNSADLAHVTSELEGIQRDRNTTRFELEDLRRHFRVSEEDRATRLEVIERQGAEVAKLSAEVDRWLRRTEELYTRVNDLEAERNRLQAEASELRNHLQASEVDRAARLEVIERQGSELGRIPALEADVAFLKDEIGRVNADREARLEVIERQGKQLGRLPTLEAEIAEFAEKLAKNEEELSVQRRNLLRASSEAKRLQIRIAMARNSTTYRILRRFGLLRALSGVESSVGE